MLRNVSIVVTLLLTAPVVHAENWPGWRGPRGDGTSRERDVPVTWNAPSGHNLAWKVPIPGEGYASPIIFGKRIFLVTCVEDSQARELLCLDRASGKTLWRKTVVTSPLESIHQQNSRASSTPATDGTTVFVTFLETDGDLIDAPNVGRKRQITPGRMVVAAYDVSGERKWLVRPGRFVSAHGFCSSPILFRDLVIVNGDHDGDSYIVALEKTTGKIAWKMPRRYKTRSYCTPLVRTIDGRTQMVFSGSKCIVALDPLTGKLLWNIEGPTEQFVASMVFDGDQFYMSAGFPTHHVMAIRPDGEGDVTDSHVAWHFTRAKCYVPSPVVVDGYLLVADDRGTANCFDAKTGKRFWQERLGNHYHASLVTANGLVYFVADDGVTKVVRPDAKLEVVAENDLGEYAFASPAISQGQIFIRGERHLFCIGK